MYGEDERVKVEGPSINQRRPKFFKCGRSERKDNLEYESSHSKYIDPFQLKLENQT